MVGLTAACASTQHSDEQVPSGFLANYDRLVSPGTGEAAFWADPKFDLEDYDAVLVPEVELWDLGRNVAGLAADDAERLASWFQRATEAELRHRGWRIATAPGARVLSVRIALTELNGANRFGNILSSVPEVPAASFMLLAAPRSAQAFVGKASAELQLVDSGTSRILAEACDRRVGTGSTAPIGDTWADVEDALKTFASRIATGLSKPQ